MIFTRAKLSILKNRVVKNRHISSRIYGVYHASHQHRRYSYAANPLYVVQQNKILNTAPQLYLQNQPAPICLVELQSRRFAHNKNQSSEECEPKKKSRKGFYLAGAVLAFCGVIGYAKYDPEFRAWLDENVPGSDNFVSIVFQEEKTYLDYISEELDSIKDKIADAINNAFSSDSSRESADKSKAKSLPPCDAEQKPYKPPRSAFKPLVTESPKKEDVKYTERRIIKPSAGTTNEPTIVQDDDDAPKTGILPAPEHIAEQSETTPQTLVELEENIGNHAQIAIKNYTDAICVLRDHADEIYKLFEKNVAEVDKQVWAQIKEKSIVKEKLVSEAELNAKVAEKAIQQLKSSIDNPKLIAPKDVKERAKKNMQKVLADVAESRKAFERERAKASVTEKYWGKVEEARKYFNEQLEALFPNIKLNDKQLKLADGEVDLFILYAYQNIAHYQSELLKLETVGDLRIKQALEQSKSGDPELVKSVLEAEIEKEKRKLNEDFQKKTLELKAECEKDIRNQLRRQSEAHNDHINEALALKEKEVERKLQRKVDDKILEERTKMKEELAGMVARLKGFDEAIKKRADQEKAAQQSQILWSACQTLVSSLKNSNVNEPYSEQLKPLKDEVNAISKAAVKDDLVNTIVKSIPEEALERGIYSEDALRERFLNVERYASRLALVPEDGASLPLILLSYLQYFFIIKNPLPIPAYELANEPIDPSSLNTFDILQRARFWMDRGDFAQTLKYMNLLQGGARAVAKDWIKETQLMLETQQAANVLMTHASASGLVYS